MITIVFPLIVIVIVITLAGSVYAQQENDTENRIKTSTNYDKILRSIIDECSVKSMSLNNDMTLLERVGCIEIIDKMIAAENKK